MDLYTLEDMRRDKRMAILKYAAVATVFVGFIALASINTPVFSW